MSRIPDAADDFVEVDPEIVLPHLIGDLPPGELRIEDVRSAGRLGARYAVFCLDSRRFITAEGGVLLFRPRWDGGEEHLLYRLGAIVSHTIKPPRPTAPREN